jgi:hypothetical protein
MSQSEFDMFSDGILAELPEDVLSFPSGGPMEGILDDEDLLPPAATRDICNVQGQLGSPTLDGGRALVLSGSASQVIFQGAGLLGVHDRSEETPLFASSQSISTHVSVSPEVSPSMSSPFPSSSTGPFEWTAQGIRLSERAVQIRSRLLQVLRDAQEDHVVEALSDVDAVTIAEGVDLVIAGMLEHESRIRDHAQQPQTAIDLLVTRRGLHLVQHSRFQTLLQREEGTVPRLAVREFRRRLATGYSPAAVGENCMHTKQSRGLRTWKWHAVCIPHDPNVRASSKKE